VTRVELTRVSARNRLHVRAREHSPTVLGSLAAALSVFVCFKTVQSGSKRP
jgi:hypothetical protein